MTLVLQEYDESIHLAAVSWVGLKIETKSTKSTKIYEIQCLHRPIVSATCLNQQRQPPTLSGRRTWTVDEIEVASSLNFSILVECSLLNACECVDFVSST